MRFDLTKEVEFPLPDEKKTGAGPVASPAPGSQKNLKRGRTVGRRDSLGSGAGTPLGQKAPKRARGSVGSPHPSKGEGTCVTENEDPNMVTIRSEGIEDTPTAGDDDDAMEIEEVKREGSGEKIVDAQPANDAQSTNGAPSARAGHGSLSKSTNEISKVRNLCQVQIGQHLVEPWYFSPYPVEFTEEETIYICEFCLSYFATQRVFARHRKKCMLLHPPGNEIYRDDAVSFFEVDGRRQRTWARNLSLLSKLFLDHKTTYSDVDPFLFYCMTTRDAYGCHLVGYFSKEKGSPDGYNVACILTLPQYQRSGYGRLLIEFSYTLSKREGKQGSPEKPLSDLGLLSYRAYWQETVVDALLEAKGEITVDELAQKMAMTPADVLHTLLSLNALKFYVGFFSCSSLLSPLPTHIISPLSLLLSPSLTTKPSPDILTLANRKASTSSVSPTPSSPRRKNNAKNRSFAGRDKSTLKSSSGSHLFFPVHGIGSIFSLFFFLVSCVL